ncbi:hypothetical protein [Streptomyces atratus]
MSTTVQGLTEPAVRLGGQRPDRGAQSRVAVVEPELRLLDAVSVDDHGPRHAVWRTVVVRGGGS